MEKLAVVSDQIVTSDGVVSGTVYCEDGVIVRVAAEQQPSSEWDVVDARGKIVFPGFIDPHVHSRDPGLSHKEDFEHSTRGALSGGVTTILEMPNAVPPVDSAEALRDRASYHEKSAWVDFGLWGLSVGDGNLDQLAGIVEAGAVAVKVFWGYALRATTRELVYNLRDFPENELILPPDNGAMLRIFRAMADTGAPVAAHCEDRDILAASGDVSDPGAHPYQQFLASRPAVAEAAAVSLGSELAHDAGAHFHVVHLGSAAGVAAVRGARARGFTVTAETCPQYLTLTDEDYDRAGPMMKVYPPIRKAEDRDALWGALADQTIVSIGSDHAPHTLEEKAKDLATQPAGAVGCETYGPVLASAMLERRVDLQEMAGLLSTNTAKLYGLYPKKGLIAEGSDADLTIVDPTTRRTIRNEDLVAKHPVSPWNGVDLVGIPSTAILRGRIAMQDGRVVGEQRGRFVPADHKATRRQDLLPELP